MRLKPHEIIIITEAQASLLLIKRFESHSLVLLLNEA